MNKEQVRIQFKEAYKKALEKIEKQQKEKRNANSDNNSIEISSTTYNRLVDRKKISTTQ